jgi:prepilin-type N-terminal cleavage/methylation domain-containing protein
VPARTHRARSITHHHGLTLLELLLAIALLLSLSALALPSLVGVLDERAFESTQDVVKAHLLLARAHAQQTGRPVEVIYDPADNRLTARMFDVQSLKATIEPAEAPENAARGDEPDDASPSAPLMFDDDAAAAAIIPESWAVQPLRDELSLRTQPPPWMEHIDESALLELESFEGFSAPFGPDFIARQPEDLDPIRLAIYLPDGTALLALEAWLIGPEPLARQLVIDAWTGQPAFRLPADVTDVSITDDEVSDDSADDPDALLDDTFERDASTSDRAGTTPSRDESSSPSRRDSNALSTDADEEDAS